MHMAFFRSPRREYLVIGVVLAALIVDYFLPAAAPMLWAAALVGAVPTLWEGVISLWRRKITIEAFNAFALAVSFVTGEITSSAFIVLMLSSASLLDWNTRARAKNAVEELLRLKPEHALRVEGDREDIKEVSVEAVREGDILLIKEGGRVPADGVIVFGRALMNESSVTGESVPVEKKVGDLLLGGTLNESGTTKIRAVRVGKDSTLERMASLIAEAQKNKSRSERIADRFAGIFMPIVLIGGILVYALTKNVLMTAALFLVACADDMAVAIPLAITAALGKAASRGVIVKGGEWLTELGKIDALVLDKTGTLTYGSFAFREAEIEPKVPEDRFWTLVGAAEKFSEHPVGRAIYKEAAAKLKEVPSPSETKTFKGNGVWARFGKDEIAVGDEGVFEDMKIRLNKDVKERLAAKRDQFGGTVALAAINGKYAGMISVADVPRDEAKASISALREVGVKKVVMFTGDNAKAAAIVSAKLGLDGFVASMSPEDKLRNVESLAKTNAVAMVGDGVNDAPVLARADVGIAMGKGGAAVAVEAADVVILTDDLNRLPEMVALGRRTTSVINWDMAIWVASNAIGFLLVLTGIAGPAGAAFYNFATDFFPLINSSRLFR